VSAYEAHRHQDLTPSELFGSKPPTLPMAEGDMPWRKVM